MKVTKHEDIMKTFSAEAQTRIAAGAKRLVQEELSRRARKQNRVSRGVSVYTVSRRKNGVWAVVRQNAQRATSLHKSEKEARRAAENRGEVLAQA